MRRLRAARQGPRQGTGGDQPRHAASICHLHMAYAMTTLATARTAAFMHTRILPYHEIGQGIAAKSDRVALVERPLAAPGQFWGRPPRLSSANAQCRQTASGKSIGTGLCRIHRASYRSPFMEPHVAFFDFHGALVGTAGVSLSQARSKLVSTTYRRSGVE